MLIEVVGPPIRHKGKRHAAGQRLDLPDALALAFVSQSRAKRVAAVVVAPAPSPAPTNPKRR